MSKNDPSKLRQEAGTPDCVWFDVRGNTRITPQFNGALPYGYCVIERRVATTYAKTAGLVPGRLQPELPGMFPEDGQVTPLLPSSLPKVCARYRACASPFANRALASNVWECC